MSPGTTVTWTNEIFAYNTWKIKVNFIVSDPETVIMTEKVSFWLKNLLIQKLTKWTVSGPRN